VAAIAIQVLRTADCPHADVVRDLAQRCLRQAGLAGTVEESVGAFASPTVVIRGVDVMTGVAPVHASCCRLDLPSEADIAKALRKAVAL
jgi:hypothetical protein